jgi:hypothetical protein
MGVTRYGTRGRRKLTSSDIEFIRVALGLPKPKAKPAPKPVPKPKPVPERLLDAAVQYKARKRWTGFVLTDDEKTAIREAIKGGATAVEAAKAAM